MNLNFHFHKFNYKLGAALVLSASLLCNPFTGFTCRAYESSDTGYLVRLKPDVSVSTAALSTISESDCIYYTTDAALVRKLQQEHAAVYTERDTAVTLNSEAVDFPLEIDWNLQSDAYGIDAKSAWNQQMTGSGVRIAVIDSGIYREHEDFQNVAIETGCNEIGNNANTNDTYGHGTQIAGIIAANAENNLGIRGLCDRVTIVPIKAFDSATSSIKHVVSGIYKAVDSYNCDVINLSLGVTTNSRSLKEAIDYAAQKNVIVVAAVGNNGERDASQLLYPAAYSSVIGVGAYGQTGDICKFSHVNNSVFVTAPGENITTLDCKAPDSYCRVSGTSFAAAQVSALAIMAKQYDSDMTVAEFQSYLQESARDAGAPGYDTAYGYGRVSVSELLNRFQNQPLYPDIRNHWAREKIEYCSEQKLLFGSTDGLFHPNDTLTRAMVVSVLWHMAGTPDAQSAEFTDVPTNSWYEKAVNWAAEHKIVSGYDEMHFAPDAPVTREQLATMLYHYAQWAQQDTTATQPTQFDDWNQVSGYAVDALSWAVEWHIINGKTAVTVAPKDSATRAEFAAMLYQYLHH